MDLTTSTLFTFDELHRQTSRQLPEGVIAGDTTFTETMNYSDTPLANLLLLTTPEISVGLGQIEYTVDFEGRVTAYRYDNSPNGGGRLVAKYYYDEHDDYTTDAGDDSLDNPDEVVSYTYDALGRQTQVVQDFDPGSVGEERTTNSKYDAFRRLIQTESPEGIVNHAYDAVGRVNRTWTSVGTTGLDLDNAITDTTYGYDELGRLETVTVVERNDGGPLAVQDQEVTWYFYDAVGNLDYQQWVKGNDPASTLTTDYKYDALNRLIRERQFGPETGVGDPNSYLDNTELADYEYTVDTDGQRIKLEESLLLSDGVTIRTAEIDWLYDDLGRLTQERLDSSDDSLDYTTDFLYDLVGNRISQQTDHGNDTVLDEIISYAYDDNDRLLEEKKNDLTGSEDRFTAYEYGPSGAGTAYTSKTVYDGLDDTGPVLETTTYAYNLQGRLQTVTGGSSTSTYTYSDSGIRVTQAETAGGVTTTTLYVVDANNPTGYAQVLEEKASTGTPTAATPPSRTYTLGHDVVAQIDAASPTRTLLKDGHGSTRQLVDETGQVIGEVYAYRAYGEALGYDPATAETPIQYAGQWFQASVGMQYLRARWYDPVTGRFNRFDPYVTQDPLSLHKYLYGNANPVMNVDPTGLFSVVSVAVGNSIGSIISEINVSVGESVLSSLGIDESFDLASQVVWAGASWVWEKLPQNVQNAINEAVDFVLEHGVEVLSTSTVAIGILGYKKIRFFDKLAGYFNKLANLTPTRRITAQLSETASDNYRKAAGRIWKNVTGYRASEHGLEIHHRIPLEWAHVFPDAHPNRIANLVGIDSDNHYLVTAAWGEFKNGLNGRQPTQAEIVRHVFDIEYRFQNAMRFLG